VRQFPKRKLTRKQIESTRENWNVIFNNGNIRRSGDANSSNNLHGRGRVISTEGTQYHEFI